MRDATHRNQVGLPPRVFLYTFDQIALMLAVSERDIRLNYIYFEGRSVGRQSPRLMKAINIHPDDDRPDWRVAEAEFVRWLKGRRIRYYERRL